MTARYTDPPGRNSPCPCQSGKKYKHCCWRTKDSPVAKHALAQEAERVHYEKVMADFRAKCAERGLDPEVELDRLTRQRKTRARGLLAAILGTFGLGGL